jgi:hypothetical protein
VVFEEQSSWSLLGVAPGATIAEIKRAYARRVREIRPDENAEGFQMLVEARDLALQFASDGPKSERSAQAPGWKISEFAGNDIPQPERQLIIEPLTASARIERPVTHALGETSAEPQVVLHKLQRVLASDALKGWQTVVTTAGQLTRARRAALEPEIIECLSSFAAQECPNLAAWPPDKWVFFDLVAALEAEYGWRGNDRAIHATLDEQAAQDFIRLLKWAQRSVPVGASAGIDVDKPGPMPVSPVDLHHFYDRGRDRRGLEAYWRIVSDLSLWRPCDAATDLFLPAWSVQEKRYGRAFLGLLGWTALAVAFAPWRSNAFSIAPPSTAISFNSGLEVVSGMLLMIVALWTIIGSSPPHSPHRKTRLVGPLWDSLAFLAFPFWAMARGLYLRALVGLIAWTALVYQVASLEHGLGLLGAVMLVVMLHITAGEYGQRWIAYKLQRTISVADRRRIFDPAKRAGFLRKRGTRSPAPWIDRWRPRASQPGRDQAHVRFPMWWRWALAAAVMMAVARVVGALWFR